MTDRKWCALAVVGDVGGLGLRGCAFHTGDTQRYLTDRDCIKLDLQLLALAGYTFIAHEARNTITTLFWPLGLPVTIHEYNGRFNRGTLRPTKDARATEIWDLGSFAGVGDADALGRAVGLSPYPQPQRLAGGDPDRFEWRCDAHLAWECLECFAAQRAESAYLVADKISALCAGWGVTPRHSVAGTAIAAWKALDDPTPCAIGNAKILTLGREAYLAGRVEAFKLGHFPVIYKADMRSAYGWALATIPMPDPSRMAYLTHVGVDGGWLQREGVVSATVHIPPSYVPPLPINEAGERIFPTGTIKGAWPIRELRYAVGLGCAILEVERVAFSLNVLYPFEHFTGIMWALREDTGKDMKLAGLFARAAMRHIYGRLGMDGWMEEHVSQQWDWQKVKKGIKGYNFGEVNGERYLEKKGKRFFPDPYRNVVWAAQITGAVRVRLHQHLLAQGSSLVYAATDSVFSLAPITGLEDGIGGLAAKNMAQELLVAGPGHYMESDEGGNWRGHAYGIPREKAAEYLQRGETEYSRIVRPGEHLRRGIPAGTRIPIGKKAYPRERRRTPVNPEVLTQDSGWTDTLPPSSSLFG